jgi:hypothetical protein
MDLELIRLMKYKQKRYFNIRKINNYLLIKNLFNKKKLKMKTMKVKSKFKIRHSTKTKIN